MSDQLVEFTEKTDTYKWGKDPEPETFLIDPEKVDAVIPHETYTTIRAGGWFFHVQGTRQEVLSKLGKAAA
jgi:hypothetical protein